MYRNQHWASDVVGGVIVGATAARVTAHWLRHKKKPPKTPGVAPPEAR
jgi:membrane-associated phospholipid phosphatase